MHLQFKNIHTVLYINGIEYGQKTENTIYKTYVVICNILANESGFFYSCINSLT